MSQQSAMQLKPFQRRHTGLLIAMCCAMVCSERIVVSADLNRFESDVRPVLNSLCLKCHGAKEQEGDFRIDTLDPDLINGNDAETWRDVLDRINLGEMPPPESPALSKRQRQLLVDWLTSALHRAAAAKRYAAGRVVTRRLTRYEYQNTMRDLLGVDLNYAAELPPEPMSSDGFLNNGATLEMSPTQLEAYLKAARLGLAEAIVSGEMPKVHRLRAVKTAVGKLPKSKVAGHEPVNPEFIADLNPFPRHGEFRIRIRAGAIIPEGHDFPRLRLSLGCLPGIIHVPRKVVGEVDVTASVEEPQTFVFRGRMEDFPQPGDVPFGNVAFDGMMALIDFFDADGNELRDPSRTYSDPPPRKKPQKKSDKGKPQPPPRPDAPPLPEDRKLDIVISSVEFEAPWFASWPPPSHTRILFKANRRIDDITEVRAVLTRFMARAFRRPVTDHELDSTLRLYETIRSSSPTFEEALRETLAAVLVSPHFLYIVEPRDNIAPSDVEELERLNDYELANRLSYFLWSSMPDAELFELAERGRLHEPATLADQVQRMLQDERSREFVTRFADQWFDLGALDRVAVNPEFFPDFDVSLKLDMRDQTRAFFEEVLRRNESCLDLLDSDWTMLNRPLAQHYGMTGPRSTRFERVALAGNRQRGGLLGQGAFLLSNATGETSHPIKRAVWILDRLLDSPPAAPPPDVPELDAESPDLAGLSLKEQLAVHRQKEACANCHRGIDPWGIPLENFDAVGLWHDRTSPAQNRKRGSKQPRAELTQSIDSSSVLPDGSEIRGLAGLKAYLIEHRRDFFARAIVKRLTAYALGRSVDLGDEATIHSLSRKFSESGYRLTPLIVDLVHSDAFLSR